MDELNNEKENSIRPPRVGEIVEGTIIGKEKKGVFLDLGVYGTGVIYGKELLQAKNELKDVKVGDKIFAKIIELENDDGYLELSVKEAGEVLAWETLKQKKENNESLSVKISGANKGGLLAEVFGVPAFLPVSQLSPEHYPRVEGADPAKILRELQNFVGKTLELKIFDFSQKEGKLILSEKAKESEKIKEILKNYKVGDEVEGEITGLTNFGAFIKFGKDYNPPSTSSRSSDDERAPDLEGLVHISELDWKIIEDPSEVVKVGEKVKVKIIDIANDKVSLSLKALKKDPWHDIEKKYKKGDAVKGEVTKFNPFGAFVQISPQIQGLCHISEFGTQKKMEEKLKIGGKYNFQILLIDPKEHRMTLKLVEE